MLLTITMQLLKLRRRDMDNSLTDLEAAIFEKDADLQQLAHDNSRFLTALSGDLVSAYATLQKNDIETVYLMLAGIKKAVDLMQEANDNYAHTITLRQITPVASELIH